MAVSSVLNTATSTATTSTRNTGELGKDDFLQLLVTQLKYQNPLDPMDDKEFISQMAQFSSLEQMQSLNSSFSSMKAFNLMGKTITASTTNDTTGEVTEITGIVKKVKIESGNAYVEVNGTSVPVDDITEINNTTADQITDLMPLIGKDVNATLTDGTYSTSVSGQVSGVNKISGVDYAELDNVELSDIDVDVPEYNAQYKIDYLNDNIGEQITIKVKDEYDNEFEVEGTLVKAEKTDGKINVVLNGVSVEVNNVTGILQDTSSSTTE